MKKALTISLVSLFLIIGVSTVKAQIDEDTEFGAFGLIRAWLLRIDKGLIVPVKQSHEVVIGLSASTTNAQFESHSSTTSAYFDGDQIAISASTTDHTGVGIHSDRIVIYGSATITPPYLSIGGIFYEWPSDDGNADEVLSTNGSGLLDWKAVSSMGVGAAWEEFVSGVITPTTTNAGIWVTSSSTISTLTILDFLRATSSLDFWLNASSTIARDDELHDAVTLAGTPNYLTLSGQEITLTKLDISDDTNATGGTGITISANDFSFDCSEVEGAGINCTGEAVTLDATGDWTGTFDGQEGTYYLDWDNFTNKPATSTVLSLLVSDFRIEHLNATTTLFDSVTTTDSLAVSGSLVLNSERFTDLSGDGLEFSSGALIFDCSDVASTGLSCSGENLTVDLGTSIDTSEIDANTIQGADIEQENAWADNDIITYDSASDGFTGLTCAEITGSADLCDGDDATGGGGSAAWEKVGDNLQPTSTLLVLAPNGLQASSTVLFEHASTSDNLSVGVDSASDDDFIYFDSAGTEHLKWDNASAQFEFTDDLEIDGHYSGDATDIDVPTYYFDSDTDTGLGSEGANTVGVSVGGSIVFNANTTEVNFDALPVTFEGSGMRWDNDGTASSIISGGYIFGDGVDSLYVEIEDGAFCVGSAGVTCSTLSDGEGLFEADLNVAGGLVVDADNFFSNPGNGDIEVGDTFNSTGGDIIVFDGDLSVCSAGCTETTQDGGGFVEVEFFVGDDQNATSTFGVDGDVYLYGGDVTSTQEIVAEGGFTGQPWGYVELDDDGDQATFVAFKRFGQGSAENADNDELGVITWDGTQNEFTVRQEGIYHVVGSWQHECGSSNTITYRITVGGQSEAEKDVRCDVDTDPSTVHIEWMGFVTSTAHVYGFIEPVISGTLQSNSTFSIKRIY